MADGLRIIQDMGIKDLEHVTIKSKNAIQFGDRQLEAGEPVLYFENIQMAVLSENTRTVAARGGFYNEPRVMWESRDEAHFAFSNGTLNQYSFELLLGSKFLEQQPNLKVPFADINIELDNNGIGYLTHEPLLNEKIFVFIFSEDNIQERIKNFQINGNQISLGNEYAGVNITVDYYFNYEHKTLSYTLARERLTNLYTLEATFDLKDENNGIITTGLIEMPKVHIVSNINLRLGELADPMVSAFNVIAMPEKKGNQEEVICQITLFDEDITGI